MRTLAAGRLTRGRLTRTRTLQHRRRAHPRETHTTQPLPPLAAASLVASGRAGEARQTPQRSTIVAEMPTVGHRTLKPVQPFTMGKSSVV